MHLVQYVVLIIIQRASRLAISEETETANLGDSQVTVWPIASVGVPGVFLVEACGLKVDLFFTVFMPN